MANGKWRLNSLNQSPISSSEGIPRDADTYARSLICPTADLGKATSAAKAGILADSTLVGFVLYDKLGVEIARWMSSEEAGR
jgi:hypothetical protein